MEIKSLNILKYGPLKSINLTFQNGLNVIYGPNGSGKTLILEALQKFFMGRKKAKKVSQEIIEDYPIGELVIYDDENKISFDGKQTIESCSEILCDDLDNIFIIKDGMCEITDEQEFYHDIIPRLIGLDLDEIEIIKENLLLQGRMTSPSKLSDNKKLNKPKTQLTKAKTLISDIEDFLKNDLIQSGIGFLVEISQLKQQKDEIIHQIEIFEEVKKIREIKNLENHLEIVINSSEKVKELEKPEFSELEGKCNNFLLDLKTIQDYQSELITWRNYSFIFFILSLIPVLTAILNPDLLLLGFISIFGFLGIVWCVIGVINTKNKITARKNLKREIFYSAKNLMIPHDNIDSITEYLSNNRRKIDSLSTELLLSKGVLKDSELFKGIQVEEINYLNLQQILNQEKNKVDMTISLDFNEDEFIALKKTLKTTEDNIEKLRVEKEAFDKNLHTIVTNCSKIPFDFEDILGEVFEWEIANIESLELYLEWLKELVAVMEKDMEINTEAYHIFDKIYEKETQKIAEFLNTDTKISEFINRITNGMFKEVKYDPNEGSFILVRESDIKQNLDQISHGELSQLYFAVRLALSKKCLDKGFILMENPFLTSDEERFEEQLKLVKNFVETGWQIIILVTKKVSEEKLIESGGTLIHQLVRII